MKPRKWMPEEKMAIVLAMEAGMGKMYTTIKFLICFLILFYIGNSNTKAQKVRIEKEDGVTVVYNPKKPVVLPDFPSQMIFREDLIIGIESGDVNYMFSDVSRMEVDDEEDIIVMDFKEACIKIYDKNGRFIKRFGKKGQGPGEIQSFGSMALSNKFITINDISNHRFTYYNKNGDSITQISTGKYRPSSALPDSRGFIYGEILSLDNEVLIKLIKFNQEFNPLKTIAAINMPKQAPPPILMERIYFQVRKDDTLIWGRTFLYVLNVLTSGGVVEKRIIRDYDPIRVTKGNLKKEIKKRYPDRPIPPTFIIPSHFPKYFPVFHYFICDDEGRIYVCHFFNEGPNCIYDVFDAEGRFISQLSHPQIEMLAVIKKGKAYFLIKANEAGIPQIKRYELD